MSVNTTILDVCEDIRAGREPFSKVMATVASLPPRDNLIIIAPFEPTPLFHVLAKQGFSHESKQNPSGDWQVLFTRNEAPPAPVSATDAPAIEGGHHATPPREIVELDARGLEPPQPLVTILEALATLRLGAMLQARTDRRPMHLYAELEARGFAGDSTEQPDGSFITHIRRR